MSADTPWPGPASSASSASAPLADSELDVIEDELAHAERTLALLADDDIDPAAAVEWLPES